MENGESIQADLEERRRRRREEKRKRIRRRRIVALAVLAALLALITLTGFVLAGGSSTHAGAQKATTTATTTKKPAVPANLHPVKVPKEIRGVHVTMALASVKGKMSEYYALRRQGLNTIELDVKDENGEVGFVPSAVRIASAGRFSDRKGSSKVTMRPIR